MERFCKDLKEHARKVINYTINEMIAPTYEENKFYEKQSLFYIQKSI